MKQVKVFHLHVCADHLDQLKGEALVKDAVDFCSAGQLHCVHLVPRALDPLLKVHGELLHHSESTVGNNERDFLILKGG